MLLEVGGGFKLRGFKIWCKCNLILAKTSLPDMMSHTAKVCCHVLLGHLVWVSSLHTALSPMLH